MAQISYNVSGTYPPFGVELRENDMSGTVIEKVIAEEEGTYVFDDISTGNYVIVIYDTSNGFTVSPQINIT